MKNPSLKRAVQVCACAAIISALNPAQAQVTVFTDTFATDTSGAWSVFANTADYSNRFAFNYSTNKYVKGGVTNNIPLSPSSTPGETNGLKITVNDTLAQVTAVNLYPTGQSFTNDYALKFDMWLNYTGTGFGNGTGGTEDAIFGINHFGNKSSFSATGSAIASAVGDGVSFAVSADGDYTRDYQSFVGDNIAAPVELLGATGGFLDRDGDSNVEFESSGLLAATHPLKLMFPSPTFESAGMPAKEWVQVEVRQRTNNVGGFVVSWLINGYLIAEHLVGGDAPYYQTNGNVMIGMMDPFTGIGTPAQDSFMIYDNVRVINLNGAPATEVLSIAASDASGGETPDDDGTFTITRTGSTASALTVPFRLAGTATRNSDYQIRTNGVVITNGTSVIIPAGFSTVDVTVDVLNDSLGESTESAILVLAGNPNAYDIRSSISATVDITDDGDLPVASMVLFRNAAYEGNTNSYGEFRILLSNPYNLGDVTVNYTLSGTAANGTHYETIPASATFPAGTTTNQVFILAKQNVDSVSNRIATLTLTPGALYTLTTNASGTNASLTIFNDDLPTATGTLYSDNFDVNSSASWNINISTNNCDAAFAFDYSTIGIPSAPRSIGGSTLGLKLRANSPILGLATSAAQFPGITVSPQGQNFTGDYRMRFDAWLNYPGPLATGGAGSTMLATFGITRGTVVQWSGFSTASPDAVFFGMTGDGGSGNDWRVFTNIVRVANGTPGVYAAGTGGAGNNLETYYSPFGQLSAPPAQSGTFLTQSGVTSSGAPGLVWHDVVITKSGSTVTWSLDGIRIGTVNSTRFGVNLSTNVFIGQADVNGTQTTVALDAMHVAIYDNLIVESLVVPTVTITSMAIVSGPNVQVDFTSAATTDEAAFFLLFSSPVVNGTYTNVNATVTQTGVGTFRAVTPYTTNAARFYRIRR